MGKRGHVPCRGIYSSCGVCKYEALLVQAPLRRPEQLRTNASSACMQGHLLFLFNVQISGS